MTAQCHSAMQTPPGRHRPVREGRCDLCHAPDAGGHRYPILRAGAAGCTGCHEVRRDSPVQHAAMTDDACLACHDPHGVRANSLVKAASTKDACSACHPRSEGPVVHPPYSGGRCELCHESHGAEGRGLLRATSIAESCGSCHPAEAETTRSTAHTHAKVEGSCLACHSPHSASFKGLLDSQVRESCVRCHKDVASQVSGAGVSHDAVLKGEQCVRCHDPHGSDHAGMLRQDQAQTCLSCHDTAQKAADGRTVPAMGALVNQQPSHRVTGHQECSGCHSVHGGNHARLLKAVNPNVPMGPADARTYTLCFACHDPGLSGTVAATQFRDADRNLHAVHLQSREKAMGCSACHAVHALGEPRLIAKSVNFEGSGWQMPMNFVPNANGGSCGPGCHEQLGYDRSRPASAMPTKAGGAP